MKIVEIKWTFQKAFNNNPNPLTPEIIRYHETDKHIVELSHGTGLFSPDLYGVTVLHKEGSRTELSKAFSTKKEALDHIKSLDN